MIGEETNVDARTFRDAEEGIQPEKISVASKMKDNMRCLICSPGYPCRPTAGASPAGWVAFFKKTFFSLLGISSDHPLPSRDRTTLSLPLDWSYQSVCDARTLENQD